MCKNIQALSRGVTLFAKFPPYFHARYGEFEATIDIDTQEVIQGELPRSALNLVQEWAMIHTRGIT